LVLIGIYYHYNPPVLNYSPSPRHTSQYFLVSKVVRLEMMT